MTRTDVHVTRGLYAIEDLKDWCYRNVGNIDKWYYAGLYESRQYKFRFTHEDDATAFKLRFSL